MLQGVTRALAAALMLAIPATLSAQVAEPVYGYDRNDARPAELSSLSPDPAGAPYAENWDLWFWTDDGRFVMLQFVTSSFISSVERQGSARIVVIDPGALNHSEDAIDGVYRGDRGFNPDRNDWGWNEEEPLDVFWLDCHIRGDGETFEVAMRGRDHRVTFEATLTAEAPLWQPGVGSAIFGNTQSYTYDMQVLPRFRFDGRLNLREGRDEPDNWSDLAGVGVMQHSRLNALPYQIGQSWTRFRALRDDGLSINFEAIRPAETFYPDPIGWLVVTLHGEVIFQTTQIQIIPRNVQTWPIRRRSYDVPTSYDIVATSGADQVVVRVRNGQIVSAEDPFRQLDRTLRLLIADMMSPADFDLSTDYEADITIGGITAWLAGSGWSSSSFTKG